MRLTYLTNLEGFACNYNSGKDLGDFMKATEKWNDYVDETGVAYSDAWVFTPDFYTEDQKADAYWIGVPTWEDL